MLVVVVEHVFTEGNAMLTCVEEVVRVLYSKSNNKTKRVKREYAASQPASQPDLT